MPRPKLTDAEVLQAFTDTMGAIVTAIGEQVDPIRLHATLQAIADQTERAGHGPSAGLIDEMARVVRDRLLQQRKIEH